MRLHRTPHLETDANAGLAPYYGTPFCVRADPWALARVLRTSKILPFLLEKAGTRSTSLGMVSIAKP